MMTTIHRLGSTVAFAVCALVMLALCLLRPTEVTAQWTTPDASQNISNTNTGNVGIGTTVPAYKLDLSNSVDKSQMRFGMGTSDSGGYLFSGGFSHAALSAGASSNGGWIARSLSASIFEANMGELKFYANSGLSTGSPFTPTERMRISSNGYVGIGTTAVPSHKLHVRSGTDSATTLLFLDTGTHGGTALAVSGNVNNESGFDMSVYRAGQYFSRFGVNNFGNVYMQPAGGSVGFGTASPNALLDLASTTQLSNRIRLSGQEYYQSGNTSTSGVDIRLGTNRTGERQIWFADSANAINATTAQLRMRFQGTYASLDSISTNGTIALPLALNATGGNVGIGTPTPNALYKLDVSGSVNASSGLCLAGDCKTAWSQVGGTSQWTGVSNIYFNTGNVGIGITAPAYKLDVNGGFFHATHNVQTYPVSSSGLAVGWNRTGGAAEVNLYNAYDNAATSFQFSQKTGASTAADLLTIKGNGNVGIGTASPTDRLHLYSPGSTYLRIGAPLASQSSIALNDDTNGQDIVLHRPANTRDFTVWTATAGSVLNVTQAGSVGIGTAAPSTKLHVAGDGKFAGNLTVDGNIAAKFQDVAEWVPSTQELPAGTVVVLDHERSNHVVASSRTYDTRVAGVVSAQPGVILGEGGAGKLMVATTGRVRVKVNATREPIKVGDLLVTGDGEGLAMKSMPIDLSGTPIHRPGTIIGKALEPLEKGTGEILVLLSLQ